MSSCRCRLSVAAAILLNSSPVSAQALSSVSVGLVAQRRLSGCDRMVWEPIGDALDGLLEHQPAACARLR